jgi:hypothetical protein
VSPCNRTGPTTFQTLTNPANKTSLRQCTQLQCKHNLKPSCPARTQMVALKCKKGKWKPY